LIPKRIILDTGPLVALLKREEQHHLWVTSIWANLKPPAITCEAVLTETLFLLRNDSAADSFVFRFLENKLLEIPFQLSHVHVPIKKLRLAYASVPMSLADACLVRMSELYPDSSILTLDSDFTIYRKNRNQTIPVIMP